jgi:hypothetical protein
VDRLAQGVRAGHAVPGHAGGERDRLVLDLPLPGRLAGGVLAALGVWVPPLAFTATFVLLHAILDSIAALVIGSVPRRVHLHAGNRLLGVAPGLVGGLINAAIVAVALTIFPLSDGVTRETRESGLARALGEPAAEMETQLAKIFDPRSSARCRR